jgi:hypothetical protein
VAGRLADLPGCEELIEGMVREARERLTALGGAAATVR